MAGGACQPNSRSKRKRETERERERERGTEIMTEIGTKLNNICLLSCLSLFSFGLGPAQPNPKGVFPEIPKTHKNKSTNFNIV